MRITKGQLRGIIRESLLLEQPEDLYVVIGNAGHGRQNMWPRSEAPEVYPKAEAERIAEEQTAGQGHPLIAWHAKPLSRAIEYVSPGNNAYSGLLDLLDKYEVEY
jgi:hypothetical protein